MTEITEITVAAVKVGVLSLAVVAQLHALDSAVTVVARRPSVETVRLVAHPVKLAVLALGDPEISHVALRPMKPKKSMTGARNPIRTARKPVAVQNVTTNHPRTNKNPTLDCPVSRLKIQITLWYWYWHWSMVS
jgi:hypothetical protein